MPVPITCTDPSAKLLVPIEEAPLLIWFPETTNAVFPEILFNVAAVVAEFTNTSSSAEKPNKTVGFELDVRSAAPKLDKCSMGLFTGLLNSTVSRCALCLPVVERLFILAKVLLTRMVTNLFDVVLIPFPAVAPELVKDEAFGFPAGASNIAAVPPPIAPPIATGPPVWLYV